MTDDLQPDEVAAGSAGVFPDLPDDPQEAASMLADALIGARADAAARTDDLKRVAAEFENFRKRSVRERDEIVRRSSQRLVEALLPVLDSFDSAFTHEPSTPGEESTLKGMQSTHQQLLDVLAREGLEIVLTVGEPFDPNVHEAVTGGGSGHLVVTAEMRRGYTLGGRVIRPAMVGVSDAETTEEG